MRTGLLATIALIASLLAGAGCSVPRGIETEAAVGEPDLAAETRAHAALAEDPPDWDAARAGFIEAAAAGSPTARAYLGWMYEEGLGVERDISEAVRWYAQAVDAGAMDFAVKLGWMYMTGEGLQPDRAQAEAWFQVGIRAGHSPARIALASVIIADALGGQHTERLPEARALLEEALADGHTMASFFLARLYIEGIGGHPVDDELAIHYTRIGADTGHPQMQGWLAFMYVNGRGTATDLVTAAMWANLAASGGDRLGNDIRVLLENSLEPAEIEEARRRAVAWALERQ
jgi:uncharacterized protein